MFAGSGDWQLTGREGQRQSFFITGELVAVIQRRRRGAWKWRLGGRSAGNDASTAEEACKRAWMRWYFLPLSVEEVDVA